MAHAFGKINWDDINWEKSYNEWQTYGQSKLANVMHGAELARRLEGTGISTYSLHPGMSFHIHFMNQLEYHYVKI